MIIIKRLVNKMVSTLNQNYYYDFVFNKKEKRDASCVIYAIGDSHTSVFTGKGTREVPYMQDQWPEKTPNLLQSFKSYRLGAITAYNSVKALPKIKRILRLKSTNFNKEKDYVLLCFGEIDIRVHLVKQMKIQQKNAETIVYQCVKRYCETIKAVESWGYKVIVFGPIASTVSKNLIEGYPTNGSCLERNQITQLFHQKLSELLNEKTPIISVFDEMLLSDGTTDESLLMDDIHLSQKAIPLIERKIKLLSINTN